MMQDSATSVANLKDGSVEYQMTGPVNGPSVILINGAGGPLMAWNSVSTRLSDRFRLLSYNRAGIGKTTRATRPQTAEFCAEQLKELISSIDLPYPYFLVGHSFGGLIANMFARKHPGQVAGVCFLESGAIEDLEHATRQKPGILQTLLDTIWKPDPNSERATATQTLEEFRQATPFPQLPVTVVTGGKSVPSWLAGQTALEVRKHGQGELVKLGAPGKHICAIKSGHFPQMSEPDVVATAIAELVTAAPAKSVRTPA